MTRVNVALAPPLMCSCCSEKATEYRNLGRVPVRITDPKVRAVIASVLLATGMRSSLVFSADKSHRVAMTRAIIAHRLRKELHYSYPAIGEFLERDHSSVIAMVRKVEKGLRK